MCGKTNNISLKCAWRQYKFWGNISYCVPSAALYVEARALVLLLRDLNSLPIYLPVYEHGADSVLKLHWSPLCHGAKLRARVLKIWFPLSNRLKVHNASQPSFNLFCFVRWWR